MKQHLLSQTRGGVLRAIHGRRGLGLGLLTGLLSVAMAFAATSWDTTALKTLSSPAERSFPDGYEVASEPNLGEAAIKKMPAGDAMVAAYLDVGNRRYYMSDWSYDRYRQGLSYNWIRPLLETSSMGSSALPEKGGLAGTRSGSGATCGGCAGPLAAAFGGWAGAGVSRSR